MRVPDVERCEATVSDGSYTVRVHRCHNRAKGTADGKRLCGLHLAAVRRRAEGVERRKRERSFDQAHYDRLEALSKQHGISIAPAWSVRGGVNHKRVSIALDDLLALLERGEG